MENVKKDLICKKRTVPLTAERDYSKFEEVAHAAIHGLGALLGVLGLVFLILKTARLSAIDVVSASIFGAALIILYSASCAYHTTCAIYGDHCECRLRDFCMKCDHSMIFVLILGTYTPACLSGMGGAVGWIIFGIVAACSLVGIALNVIDVERFKRISMVLYLVAGWTIAIASVPFYKAVGLGGFTFLLLGGLLYTIGVIFYKLRQIRYMHIVWHLFVLGGSVMHYFMIYLYCL